MCSYFPAREVLSQFSVATLSAQGTHLQKSYGFTMRMRSRSQRTSTLSRKVAGTACVSRRCSRRTPAHTPVRPGTVPGKSAPRPYSLCKVSLSCFGGMGVQLLQKPFRGEGDTGDCSGTIAASEADHCLHHKLLQSGASFPAF